MMALYASSSDLTGGGGHVAKRPRVEFTHVNPVHPVHSVHSVHSATALQLAAVAAVQQQQQQQQQQQGILSQQYIEQQLNKKSQEPEKPNHILLFTVLNPTYPITCEVLHTICVPVISQNGTGGNVHRIVIFKKNGVQAMVEFDTVETAKIAKENLHGCDIYSGCCTLKIEYAKPTKLNVYKNDSDSWDYTNPNLNKTGLDGVCGVGGNPLGAIITQRPVLLKEPLLASAGSTAPVTVSVNTNCQQNSSVVTSVNGGAIVRGPTTLEGSFENGYHSPPQLTGSPPVDNSVVARAAAMQNALLRSGNTAILTASAPVGSQQTNGVSVAGVSATSPTGTTYQHHQGAVCMVYGLNSEKMNTPRIFNLFCLYGNVVRVKFLKTKEGCAMVQMGDGLAVERVVSNLNNSNFFGTKMQLGFSKQAFLADVQSPYQLTDSSPSFQDFMGSKNNRFINPEMASKNRIQPPSKILHFFNTPPGLDSPDIELIFTSNDTPRPKCVKMFPSKTERSSSGLIEFETLSDALEALVVCNHHPIANPNGKFPYIMKLCFSSSRSIPTTIR